MNARTRSTLHKLAGVALCMLAPHASADAMDDWIAWVQILLVVDIVYMVMCFLLFEYVIEE